MENLGLVKNQKLNTLLPLLGQSLSKVKPPNLAKIKSQKRADNSLELGFKLRDEAEKQNDVESLIDSDFLIESGQFQNANHSHVDNRSDK